MDLNLNNKITVIPFYGGGKGQSLQLIEKPDGTVTTTIIKTPQSIREEENQGSINTIDVSELENPPLPSKIDLEEFGKNLRKIQTLAQKIIALQEKLKQNGKFNPTEEADYRENMDHLNESAQKLAEIQEKANPIENREGIAAWLENKKNASNIKNKNKKKESEEKKTEEEKKRKAEEDKEKEAKRKEERLEAQKKKENEKEEGNQAEKEEEKEEENEEDSIAIGLPVDDASVAEAKPVALAVAGQGGVAASKPIATAVVGPGGLAIARPISTAIAGVDPEQALIPIYAENYVLGSKPKGRTETANEYLSKLISKFHQI